jgi:23S rRNA (guanosine2251-2'-O)-methyltransferase
MQGKRFDKPRRDDRPARSGKRDDRARPQGKPVVRDARPDFYSDAARENAEMEDTGIIEGRNPVLEALKAGRTINKILVGRGEKEGSIRQIMALAKDRGIVVQETERAKLDSLSFTHSHQGVIAYAAARDYVEVEDIINAAEAKGELPFIIILDESSDAYNLGSVLRTADAVGAHGVIIPKRRAVGLTPSVAKASAGAIEYVPVARVTNLAQTIEELKKRNIWVAGTDASGERAFYESDLKGPLALVIGSEGEGMGRLIREKCDFVVNIPMKGSISSLNAAVAGAIVMYEVLKQRGR